MAYWIVLPIIAVRALSGLFLVARTASEASLVKRHSLVD
jgi:hypothetical protein